MAVRYEPILGLPILLVEEMVPSEKNTGFRRRTEEVESRADGVPR